MIEVHKAFNLSETINAFISGRRAKQRFPPTSVSTQGASILTQEKDGCILYTWDDVTEWSEGAIVTHFGLFDPASQQHQVVYVYSQRVHVVSCSVNQERTLMAFTVLKREAGHTSPDRRVGKETYNAFLAELQAQRRVFSLNLERHTFIKVQFLYTGTGNGKETNMLVMLHKESIGLYKIPMGTFGNKGLAMMGQPKTEHVAKKFVWCQWDAGSQQLFYIHLRHHGDENKQPLLSCLQFYGGAQHDAVLDVPLNFPFVHKSSGRVNYTDIPLHPGIPDTSVNVLVLSQSNGTFCVCYQHQPHYERKSSKSSPLPRTSPLQRTSPKSPAYQTSPTSSDGENNEINYYICLVHHASTLHGCVSSIPANLVKKAVLSFSWLGDLIMVTLPGHFIHLLNVGIEFDPCHHILLHNKTYTGYVSGDRVDEENKTVSQSTDDTREPVWGNKDMCPVLSLEAEHFLFVSGFARDIAGGSLFDRSTGTVWKTSISIDNLIHTFTDCYISTTRTALLHYVILRTRDYSLLKKLFQVLCNDITSAEVPGLMMEYLIGMTYGSMRRQVDREVLRLLPFTLTETFRGQLDKTSEGERLARVSYSTIHSVNIGTKTAKERQQKKNAGEDLWDTLRRHLRWMQFEKSRRFSQEMVKRAYRQLVMEEEKNTKSGSNTEEEHFLTMAKIHNSISRTDSQSTISRYTNKPDNVLGSVPPFLHATAVTEMSEKLLNLTKEILSKHLMLYLHKDSKVKANNVAKEYVNCQSQQSRLLCHMLWSLRGNDVNKSLTDQPSADEIFARSAYDVEALPCLLGNSSLAEYELFQLLERYYLSLTDLVFPTPQGFPSYFTAIAFRCLNIRLFMQYVNSGVLQLTGDFMAQVLKDLPDTDDYCKVKHFIISKLPQNSAEECYKQWGHTSCMSYFAHQQVDDHFVGNQRKAMDSQAAADSRKSFLVVRRNSALDNVSFQPLKAFLRHMEQEGSDSAPPRRYSPLDTAALEEVALHHTRTETIYDMGTVNF